MKSVARGRRLRWFGAPVVAVVSALAGGTFTPAGAANPTVGKYVALGDSYAAVGTLTTVDGRIPGCVRAADSYPAVLARTLGVGEFVNASCASATTENLLGAQVTPAGVNPPQLDALTPDTDLVTITIGGNDFGALDLAARCGTLALADPTGAPCRNSLEQGGQFDTRIAATEAKLERVYDEIRARAPHAVLVAVGYLRALPPVGTCRWQMPVADGDAVYFNQMWDRYTIVARDQIAARGALFADVGSVLGHDACQPPETRWVEPGLSARPYLVAHPNAAGQAYVAGAIADLLRR